MITNFCGEYAFLSNFHGGVEVAYQAAKFTGAHANIAKRIIAESNPGKAKKLARELRSFVREDWQEINLAIMESLVREKFQQEYYKRLLLATGDEMIVEGNSWNDRFYGCVFENGEWVGENHMGKILMKIREELRHG